MWPFLYVVDERLSRAELMAARLDGDVVEVGEGFIPADAVETSQLRAASLRPLIPATVAVTHASAAWVHGAIVDAPLIHRVQRVCAHRIPSVVAVRLQYRDGRLPPADVDAVGGTAVTTPERTVADLARDLVAGHDESGRVLESMLAWRPELLADAVAWFASSTSMHHRRAAHRLLAGRLADQEDVTR